MSSVMAAQAPRRQMECLLRLVAAMRNTVAPAAPSHAWTQKQAAWGYADEGITFNRGSKHHYRST
jgi:hypothetical protein